MSLFVDTSVWFAYLVHSEPSHGKVRTLLSKAVHGGDTLWTSSYVIVESVALLQRRAGMAAARDFEAVLPLVTVEWVTAEQHHRGWERWQREDRRRLSLVDCVSFELMKAKGCARAAALDPHFAEAGFQRVPT